MKLWQIGFVVVLIGGLVNGALIHFGIGGIFRELARLSVLIGIVILIAGAVKRNK